MTTIPRALLVSEDAELERLSTKSVQVDPVSQVVRLIGEFRLPASRHGQLRGLLANPTPEILRLLEWTTRSFNARMGFDLPVVRLEDAIPTPEGDLLFEADVVLHPGEDREGRPARSPLLEILPRLIEDRTKLQMLRLFCRAGVHPFGADRIVKEIEQQRLQLHPHAEIAADGVVLPCDDRQFPLRFDLMEDALLEQGLAGVGRGVIDELQPMVRDRTAMLPRQGFRITSTRFSLGHGRRGVLHEGVIDLQTKRPHPTARHGKSRVWDGGRTAGMGHERHLEWSDVGWGESTPLFDDAGTPTLGSKVQIYPAPSDAGNGVSVSVPRGEFHRWGFTIDQWIRANGNGDRVRETLRMLEVGSDWGVLTGTNGTRAIHPERHAAHQTREIRKQTVLYGRQGGTSAPSYPVGELGEFLRQVGNHQQRTALFCRELPSPKAMQVLLSQGVRIVFTGNVSGGPSRIYVTNNQLQRYKSLFREEGLQLYLVTPSRVRKLWNDLFVDVHKLERIERTDVRLGCYGASATNAEVLLERGGFREALAAWMKEHPRTALVSGAAVNGAMGYMNRMAAELGVLTVGIANEVQGQEVPDEELDAVMTFDRDGFEARQALMAQITTHPLVGPGSQGSAYEASLEYVLRKTGKTCFTPVPLIDPVGLGPGGAHIWAPLHELQQSFNQEYPVGDGRGIVLSRSPYVAAMSRLVSSYGDAFRCHADFMRDPEAHWAAWGVPESALRASTERTLRDSEATGFPFPSFLEGVRDRAGLEALVDS